MPFRLQILAFISSFLLFSCSPELPSDVKEAYNELPDPIDYNVHVKPILSEKCFACHGPDKAKQKAGLRLDQFEAATSELMESPGKYAIVKGDVAGSEVFHRIVSSDPKYTMPTPASHMSLSPKEKAIIIKWIEQGAVYKPHWAFVAPQLPNVPQPDNEKWLVHNAIDSFIYKRLEQEKLEPNPEASKELLLRRVSLDLTGLPPTIEEIDAFLKDNSPNAYEKQVDRLLSSPHYGEKMAVDWLDLARFADSYGYTVDRLRDMSPYRDWVIKAFNENQPYDRFVQWQLAGDLFPNPTKEMIIATAFNRNHPQNMEGGIIEEEFQTEYVVDRTNTFGNAFLGVSIGCAKCHDHKYDPFSQKNYYELFSFFNNVKESGQISWNDATPTPTLLLPTPEKEKVLQFIQQQIDEQEKKTKSIADTEAKNGFEKWLVSGSYKKLAPQPIPKDGLQAVFNFDNGNLSNTTNPKQVGKMKREIGEMKDALIFEKKDNGKALSLNGDVWMDCNPVGVFRKSDPFTISIRIFLPNELKEGVIFHKSDAERLYNFRGYQLNLKNNHLEFNIAHTAPSNAITKLSMAIPPHGQWIQLTTTYDGSSKAAGMKLYLDGKEMEMETTMDQLTKEIVFNNGAEPALQIGAWYRGQGIKGAKVDDIIVYNRELIPFEVNALTGVSSWASIASKPAEQLKPEEKIILQQYYLSAESRELIAARKELQQLRRNYADSAENIQELSVMQEMPNPKKAHILIRGNYSSPGEEVHPNTPESVLPFPSTLPKNRLGLARWLMMEGNPLTARVAVNRLWQNFFGTGLVKTTEDFGNMGQMPSHPELLDWLAVNFRLSGWDIKKMNKLIVLSATYRQDSKLSKDSREKDPENRLLSHGPSGRLSAEMLRDNALMASGLLNATIGGKSVKPYQPEGLWEINNTSYTRDSGAAVYRRSVYVVIKRSVPNPTLATFDAGERSYCLARRQKTNTPLQALVTLNDPTYLEASLALGYQMAHNTNATEALTDCYRKLTGKQPTAKEVELLNQLREAELKKFKEHPEKGKGWLVAGQLNYSKTNNATTVAANAVVANTILNSDASLSKR